MQLPCHAGCDSCHSMRYKSSIDFGLIKRRSIMVDKICSSIAYVFWGFMLIGTPVQIALSQAGVL